MGKDFYTIEEMAELLRVRPGTVRNRLWRGDTTLPPSVRNGRRRLVPCRCLRCLESATRDIGVSVEALRWARAVRAGRAKGVLWALADLADAEGVCFPSHAYLADSCEVSESTVRRMIRLLDLAQPGGRRATFPRDGSSTSNVYRLAMGTPSI